MTVNGEHVTAGAPRAGAPGMGLALNINTPRTIGGHATCSTNKLGEVLCSTALPDRSSLALSPSVDDVI